MPEVNPIVVETPAATNIVKAPTPGEMSMEEYAAQWGKKAEPVTETEAAPAATVDTAAEDPAPAEPAVEPAAPTEDTDPEALIEEAHPAKKGITKRFSEMSAKQRELQAQLDAKAAEAEASKAELEKMKAEAAKPPPAPEPVIPMVIPAEEDPLPQRLAYDDPDEFAIAMAGYTARAEIRRSTQAAIAAQAERAAQAKQAEETARQAQVQAAITTLHKNFNERVEKAKADYPDFEAKVTNNADLTIRNDIFFAIEQTELAPHVLYHLASNPTEVASLNKMNPLEAAVRLGEIQAEVRTARKPKPSKAAEPVKPIGSRTAPQPKKPAEMSMEEYAAHWQAQEAARRKKPERSMPTR